MSAKVRGLPQPNRQQFSEHREWGDPPDAIEEAASGSSGLQYNGDGYWQFNWKTPKDDASTCRTIHLVQ